jgi:uncharacterized membrane protein YhhN
MMASTAGFSSATDMGTRYAHSPTRLLWLAAAIVGAGYGVFLVVTALRLPSGAVMVLACVALLVWFWPRLLVEGMAVPVTLYIAVLGAMVCAALLARLPTPWTALGAVSDGMIGVGRFSPASGWAYAPSLVLITAGCFFGRASVPSATPTE